LSSFFSWAHAAIQGLESALLFAGQPSPLLSAQAIMDCRPWKSGAGESCVGGWYEDAYKYWQTNRAVTLQQYPYLAKDQKCAAPSGTGGRVKSWGYATPKCSGACPKQDEEQLLTSLKNYGPLSIYLDAASFQHYKGGILPASSCSSHTKDMDHAVQLVGYGTDNGKKFWVLRNSWGEKWSVAQSLTGAGKQDRMSWSSPLHSRSHALTH
jgi:cathepsin L